ncbi:hypothetical protein Celaphus_00007895 [Cervus elaphus hippelaphus]|uniref:Uncharacterized protein n=1 Tax=Cervus elaphus hippelaphus TaxID=46360 RepID=A0A212CC11_CEREH|nr:hypothetical protein Celaphus_00007895 [Cervus elaphus hippelaphus]
MATGGTRLEPHKVPCRVTAAVALCWCASPLPPGIVSAPVPKKLLRMLHRLLHLCQGLHCHLGQLHQGHFQDSQAGLSGPGARRTKQSLSAGKLDGRRPGRGSEAAVPRDSRTPRAPSSRAVQEAPGQPWELGKARPAG